MDSSEMLKKYLNNQLSQADRDAFEKSEIYKDYSKLIDTAPSFKSKKFDSKHHFKEIQKTINKSKLKRGKLISIGVISNIAALLVFGVFVLADLFTHTENYHTNVAETIEFNLPDDSNVSLAANSNLLLDNKTWLNNRSLKLKGEAFFEVEEGKVFVVNTRMGNVSVLGTSFNVKHRGKLFEVTCYSGKVQVDTGGQSYIIEAGESMQNFDGNVSKSDINKEQPDWKNGFSSFKSVAVAQVFQELNSHFDIQVNYNSINSDTKFTGSFEHGNLELALESICRPLSLGYEIFENKVIIYNP